MQNSFKCNHLHQSCSVAFFGHCNKQKHSSIALPIGFDEYVERFGLVLKILKEIFVWCLLKLYYSSGHRTPLFIQVRISQRNSLVQSIKSIFHTENLTCIIFDKDMHGLILEPHKAVLIELDIFEASITKERLQQCFNYFRATHIFLTSHKLQKSEALVFYSFVFLLVAGQFRPGQLKPPRAKNIIFIYDKN